MQIQNGGWLDEAIFVEPQVLPYSDSLDHFQLSSIVYVFVLGYTGSQYFQC